MDPRSIQRVLQDLRGLDAPGVLRYAVRRFGHRVALATSLGAEDQVLTHMIAGMDPAPAIFTLDTGRLPEETCELIEATRRRYGLAIEVLFPDREDVEALVNEAGPNCFRRSLELRKRCCHVRKVLPLRRKLASLDAWITGLRREQAPTRAGLPVAEWDEPNGLVKFNPLADWTAEGVWDYVREHNVPYNALHDRGYPSIGCAPCTRAVEPDEDIRAGRWWWESPEHKECGLHLKGGVPARKEE